MKVIRTDYDFNKLIDSIAKEKEFEINDFRTESIVSVTSNKKDAIKGIILVFGILFYGIILIIYGVLK
jgi:hypothetical protein